MITTIDSIPSAIALAAVVPSQLSRGGPSRAHGNPAQQPRQHGVAWQWRELGVILRPRTAALSPGDSRHLYPLDVSLVPRLE